MICLVALQIMLCHLTTYLNVVPLVMVYFDAICFSHALRWCALGNNRIILEHTQEERLSKEPKDFFEQEDFTKRRDDL